MKDPGGCTYPHERLCLLDCRDACKRKSSGWRKWQIANNFDPEDEAWAEVEAKQAREPRVSAEILEREARRVELPVYLRSVPGVVEPSK
jgi:hypothetical protein